MPSDENHRTADVADRVVVPLHEEEDNVLASTDTESLQPFDEASEDAREKPSKEDLEIKSLEQDIEHRNLYANRIFMFVVAWVFLVMSSIFVSGWSLLGFELSDKVLMMLIGGTTANVLGLFAIVANYLFPKK